MERFSIPYHGTSIPAVKFSTEEFKGTIVVHGGLDSFMEEFYPAALYMANAGYDVLMFEGPGQGAALRRRGLHMSHEWEKPVCALLDFLDLSDITLIGISMGGFLAPRAAAFEGRISRVIAYDVYTFDHQGNGLSALLYKFFLKTPSIYNWIVERIMRRSTTANHIINQWMYVTGISLPADWIEQLRHYSVSRIASKVQQDVLLLAGAEDHMISLKEYYKTEQSLINARLEISNLLWMLCWIGSMRSLPIQQICDNPSTSYISGIRSNPDLYGLRL
ncbi:MAG: alpha/beta fold hydrolase [Anaerolineales bacterium]|nr:alpha/beta fold hydrolase [Anaerolineales bacterium]